MTLTVTSDELRKDFDSLIEKVKRGDELLVRDKAPSAKKPVVLGFDRDRVKILGPIEGPIIPDEDWHCMRDDVSNGL